MTVATGTATLGLALLAMGVVGTVRLIKGGMVTASGRPALTPDPLWWWDVLRYFSEVNGAAIIAGWLVLALSGRRRPGRDWLDYLGRAIGVGWIVLFVVGCCDRLARTID